MSLQNAGDDNITIWDDLPQLLKTILDYSICVCLLVMLAVFPLYNEEGLKHIGTDKDVFLRKFGVSAGKGLLIFVLFYAAVCCIRLAVTAVQNARAGGSVADQFRRQAEGEKRLWPAAFVDIFALVYCGALVLSYVFTDYRDGALWGEDGLALGMYQQLMFIGMYFLISRFWKPRKWVFCIMFPVSAAVFLLGCVNRFGIYPFGMESYGSSYISTIGNINFFCGYVVTVMFAGTALLLLGKGMKSWQRALLLIYTAIGYLTLLLQGSDSGIAALAVVTPVMFCMAAGECTSMLLFWLEMTIFSAGCLGIHFMKIMAPGRINFIGTMTEMLTGKEISIVMLSLSVLMLLQVGIDRLRGKYRKRLFRILAWVAGVGSVCAVLGAVSMIVINTRHPGSLGRLSEDPLFTFNEVWGSSRGSLWGIGWKCFTEQNFLHKLVGVGPDCMWSFIKSGNDPEVSAYVASSIFAEYRLANAHNEWLTILVDTGILGLLGYGGIMICGMAALLKKWRESFFAAACGFCLLAYMVNNIFSFQQAVATASIFVILGMGVAFLRRE